MTSPKIGDVELIELLNTHRTIQGGFDGGVGFRAVGFDVLVHCFLFFKASLCTNWVLSTPPTMAVVLGFVPSLDRFAVPLEEELAGGHRQESLLGGADSAFNEVLSSLSIAETVCYKQPTSLNQSFHVRPLSELEDNATIQEVKGGREEQEPLPCRSFHQGQ